MQWPRFPEGGALKAQSLEHDVAITGKASEMARTDPTNITGLSTYFLMHTAFAVRESSVLENPPKSGNKRELYPEKPNLDYRSTARESAGGSLCKLPLTVEGF